MTTEEPWYKKGLRFKCTGCGKCCTGSPGYVWIEESEIKEMAEFLNISIKEFKCKYTRFAYGRLALLEKKVSYDCIFLEDKMCKIYGARPQQCRKFPWWVNNLKSKASWKEMAKTCEGIDHPEAPLINLKQISKVLNEPYTSAD